MSADKGESAAFIVFRQDYCPLVQRADLSELTETLGEISAELMSGIVDQQVVVSALWNPTLRKSGEGWGTHGMVSQSKKAERREQSTRITKN